MSDFGQSGGRSFGAGGGPRPGEERPGVEPWDGAGVERVEGVERPGVEGVAL